jgi:hypothetical protein
MAKKAGEASQSRYKAMVEKVFFDRYAAGQESLEFEREDLVAAAAELSVTLPKNIGDVVYSIRYRTPMPDSILAIQPSDMEWILEGMGRAKYAFKLVKVNRIIPNRELIATKIPDSTPEIVRGYALSDEQALLAVVRYNRLIDVFLGLVAYSLQNHLRTTVSSVGQVEIDEIYVAVDKFGRQFVLPVQAKGGHDKLSVVQTKQDLACCRAKYPSLICRPISAQFMEDDLIALFELAVINDEVKVVEERHYRLVSFNQIDDDDLRLYSQRS